MAGSTMIYLMILPMLLGATPAKPHNSRIMEEELTHILQEALSEVDPYSSLRTTTLSYTNSTSSFMLNVTDAVMTGFRDIVVTNFDTPVPFLSKQVSITTVVSNLTMSTDNYSMTSVCDHSNETYKFQGSAYLSFYNLTITEKFKADAYSADPVRICVKCQTLTFDISYDSVEGHLEGAGLYNSMIPIFGENLKEMVMDELMKNQDILEDNINKSFCNSQQYHGCRQPRI